MNLNPLYACCFNVSLFVAFVASGFSCSSVDTGFFDAAIDQSLESSLSDASERDTIPGADSTVLPHDSTVYDNVAVESASETSVDAVIDSRVDGTPNDGDLPSDASEGAADLADAEGSEGSEDAKADGSTSMDGAVDHCIDPCSNITLAATFGSVQKKFNRGYFGLETPHRLYIEAYHGGQDGCPSQSSPTPKLTLIVSGWQLNQHEYSCSDGLKVTLMDFSDTFIQDPPYFETAHSASIKRVKQCEDCSSWPSVEHRDTDIFVELQAKFKNGSIQGQLKAPHCASLDTP